MSSSMDQFTSKATYLEISNVIKSEGTIKVNNTSASFSKDKNNKVTATILSAIRVTQEGVNRAVNKPAEAVLDLFVAPTKSALKSFDEIGKDFDKMIKQSFIGKYTHIKGSEILCAMFCIVASMIGCEERKKIHDMLNDAQKNLSAMARITAATNEMVQTFNALSYSSTNIIQGMQDLANLNRGGAENIKANTGRIALSLAAFHVAHKNISQSIKAIKNAAEVIGGSRTNLGAMNITSVWNLAKNVLWVIESMAINIVDEIINKIVGKIKDEFFKKIIPSQCLNNATVIDLLNKLLRPLFDFARYVKGMLHQFFNASASFSLDWKGFHLKSKELTELTIALNSLDFIVGNFQTMLITCGLQLCPKEYDNYNDDLKEISNSLNSIMPITTAGRAIKPLTMETVAKMQKNNTEDISTIIAPALQAITNTDNITAGKAGLTTGITMNIADIPQMIKDMIENDLPNLLGSSHLIMNNGQTVNITYAFENLCGAGNE